MSSRCFLEVATRFSGLKQRSAGLRAVQRRQSSSLLWCSQVVFPDNVSPGSVVIKDGIILKCIPRQCRQDAKETSDTVGHEFLDLGDTCLSPGLIDVHAHISELGRNWEGYETATKAAAAGGITTLLGMPLNSLPPTTDKQAVRKEHQESTNKLYVDVGLWGGIVPGNCNEKDLNSLLNSGVFGLKAFLSPLPEAAGFEAVTPDELLLAAKITGQHNKPILVHAELMTVPELKKGLNGFINPRSYRDHVTSRPPLWEQRAVEVVCQAASYCHMHIVHLSDSGCLPLIMACKNDPKKMLTVETCPHYLMFDSSMTNEGEPLYKCFPPIRDADNRETLWEGIETIDMLASDHSPCEPSMRNLDTGNLKEAWGGLSGLQYQLPATWVEAHQHNYSVRDMARWWSSEPARLAHLGRKGAIVPGQQADLCWWDPSFVGAPNSYSRERHRWKGTTLYAENKKMRGRVLGTWLNGLQVYDGLNDTLIDKQGKFMLCPL